MQPQSLRLPHSGLTVPHDGYTVTAYKELSTRDGVAFTATLRLNRKIIGTVENDGVGGPDTFHPNHALANAGQQAALETFAAQCTDAEGHTPDVEYVLGDLVIEYQTRRNIARAAKRGNTLLRLMQDHEDGNRPQGWASVTGLLETAQTVAANRGRLRASLLGHTRHAPPPLGWWQLWQADQSRWTDLTDRPAHIPADRY
ncbi:hypothetical protein [Paractinoplanes toevensis]|uniref:Uncharacterized protein n=1 Tax=Paractinoplanes toevensis TaxID=571911 RepID=A0A919T685_9ACTN|nr:hypothetical protein [Actinoplanes toevensis]GIM90129.1 hypothetical protein Ato02nite_019220 [Actinoplanes toevensis]